MPERGAVLRAVCIRCEKVTDEPRDLVHKWYCPPCYKQRQIELIQEKIVQERQYHQVEKDSHENRLRELQQRLAVIEAEGTPGP